MDLPPSLSKEEEGHSGIPSTVLSSSIATFGYRYFLIKQLLEQYKIVENPTILEKEELGKTYCELIKSFIAGNFRLLHDFTSCESEITIENIMNHDYQVVTLNLVLL